MASLNPVSMVTVAIRCQRNVRDCSDDTVASNHRVQVGRILVCKLCEIANGGDVDVVGGSG